MQNEEKLNILIQLKALRQQSLSQYLGTNLQSLANRQVIEDILKNFISLHEDDFLTTISNNIAEMKQQHRAMKKLLKEKQEQENLGKLKLENQISAKYEKQMEQFFLKWLELQHLSFQKSNEKNPAKAICKLFDELTQHTKQNHSIKDLNNSLKKDLQAKQIESKTLSQELRTLQNRFKLVNQRVESRQMMNKSLQDQLYQKHMSIEQMMLAVKEMDGKMVNSKEMMTFLEDKACAMREENVKLKHEIDFMGNEKEKTLAILEGLKRDYEQIKHEREQIKHEREQIKHEKGNLVENEKKSLEKIQSLENNLQKKIQENCNLTTRLTELQASYQTLQNNIKQSQAFTQSLFQSKQQLYAKISQLQTKLTQKQSQLSQSFQTCDFISKQLHQKEQMMKDYVDKKDQQIKVIEQELKLLKEQTNERQEQEKQYEMYLEQIVELREKIKSLTPAKFQTQLQTDSFGRPLKIKNKRTKIYFLLTQLQSKFIQLKNQKSELTKAVASQIQEMKDYANKTISLILSKTMDTKIKCDYCQHSKSYETSLISRACKTGITKNTGFESAMKDINLNSDQVFMGRSDHSFKKPTADHPNEFYEASSANGRNNFYEECQMQKTREFSYKPSNMNSLNANAHKTPQFTENGQTKSGGRGVMKSVRSLNQKMKAINHQNSMYQMHLSRILSESNAQ